MVGDHLLQLSFIGKELVERDDRRAISRLRISDLGGVGDNLHDRLTDGLFTPCKRDGIVVAF